MSGGEGAGFFFSDYGQRGFPWLNPCNDPPAGIGGTMTPPTAEGGALRSQDIRTTGDPTDYSGTVIRVNPNDDVIGLVEALPDNPLFGGLFSDDDRIIALIRQHFDLRPKGLITMLDLLRPIYQQTAAYGHLGREDIDLSWEKTDKAEELKSDAGL